MRLSNSDRRGLLFLALVLLCVAFFRWLYVSFYAGQAEEQPLSVADKEELERFERQVREDSAQWARQIEPGDVPVEQLFVFDPNTADSSTLLRLGLRPWQVRNMMRYRRKGGWWRSPDDFRRLYGLTDEQFRRLRPYIRVNSVQLCETAQAVRDTLRYRKAEKYPSGTVVELNAADTTMLKRIPGIGSYYAGKICRYRERLGGFVSVAQVKEVDGLPEGIEKWFVVRANPSISRLNVNTATFKALARHPYLNYEQVKAIFDYRRKYGVIKGWDDLKLAKVFDGTDWSRLADYFVF